MAYENQKVVEGAMLGQSRAPLCLAFAAALCLELWALCFSEP